MSLLLSASARLLGQGITGAEGRTSLLSMLRFGTKIVAGVTPGKGGQVLEGVPIFNTVNEAMAAVGPVEGSVQFVPPLFVQSATQEALEAGLRFVLIGAEKVPTKDATMIRALAEKVGATIVGPSSVGMINPQLRLKLGAIGGNTPEAIYVPGPVAVISKSGGMTSEISLHLQQHGLGITWAIGIGGERISGTDFADCLLALESDQETKASVIFGEPGGTAEDRVATLCREGKIKKPVIAFIAGDFATGLPNEVQFGHAGAIIEGERGLPEYKRQVLAAAGVQVAQKFDDISRLVKVSLNR